MNRDRVEMGGFFAGAGMTCGVFDRYNDGNIERNQSQTAWQMFMYLPCELYGATYGQRGGLISFNISCDPLFGLDQPEGYGIFTMSGEPTFIPPS